MYHVIAPHDLILGLHPFFFKFKSGLENIGSILDLDPNMKLKSTHKGMLTPGGNWTSNQTMPI